MKKYIISYLLAFILIYLIFKIHILENFSDTISRVTIFDLLVAAMISLVMYLISGIQYAYLLSKIYKIKLSFLSMMLLPTSIGLWGYIIPSHGGFMYVTALMRYKYKIPISEGTSISIYLYFLSVFLAGAFGMCYAIFKGFYYSVFLLVSCLLMVSPILLIIFGSILNRLSFRNKFLQKIRNFVVLVVNNTGLLWSDIGATIAVLLLNVVYLAVSVFWYYWATVVFDIKLPFVSIIMLPLIMRLSLVFRITPGNLGVEQLFSGLVIYLFGSKAGDGVLISAFNSLASIIIVFTFGILYTLHDLKYFHAKNIISLLKTLRETQS